MIRASEFSLDAFAIFFRGMRPVVCLILIAIGLLLAIHSTEAEGGVTSEVANAHTLCDLLDLSRPRLAAVKKLADQGDYVGASEAYRDSLVDFVATLDMGEPPGFWCWNPTDAKDLLNNGVLATAQYGEFNRVSRYKLGPSGKAEWNKIPEDGYDVVLRDLSTMHWAGTLVEAYRSTRDPAYLKAFFGYWDDFARNWLPAHQQLLRDKTRIEWGHQPRTSIAWASQSKLYFAWRLDNLASWLAAGIAVSPAQAKAALDPQQLAALVIHVAEFEAPGAMRGLAGIGVPNQFVHCALGLFKTSLVFQDLRAAPAWTEKAIAGMSSYIDSSGYLPDGSDMEQSFNYNRALIPALDSMLYLARNNPPFKGCALPWMNRFQTARDYRERFLDAIVMPDGRRPSTGCHNGWNYSRDETVAAYKDSKGTLPSFRERISNHLLGDGAMPEPAFTSIYFPYGGWVVLRDGWTPASLYVFMKTSRPGPGHMREGGNGLAMAAYGRRMVVNSGSESYSSDRGIYNRYFDSTVSQSSVSVDGYSQVLNAVKATSPYSRPIPARWYTSPRFDVAEGIFESSYGGWNFRTGKSQKPLIDDVRHERQVIFLRRADIWIVTDRLLSAGSHEYTQSWCLGPEFGEEEVDVAPNGCSVSTHDPDGPNVELRFASQAALTCSRHYGEQSNTGTVGWRAFDWDEEQRRYAPGVDILTDWKGKGNQLVVTLIVPSRAEPDRIVEYRDLSGDGRAGFQVRLRDESRITCLTSEGGPLKAEGLEVTGQALITVTDASGKVTRGVALTADGGYEFEMNHDDVLRKIGDIRIPEGFRWVVHGEDLSPSYDGPP